MKSEWEEGLFTKILFTVFDKVKNIDICHLFNQTRL